jgi:hypothetical protein
MGAMMKQLVRLLEVWVVSSLVCVGPLACGDDDGNASSGTMPDGGGSDSNGPDAGDSGSADGGDSDAGDSGSSDAGVTQFSRADCLEMQSSNTDVSMACLDCACRWQPYSTAYCDEHCWDLLMCLGAYCHGNFEDFDCVSVNCPQSQEDEATSQAMAMVVTLAVLVCEDACDFGAEAEPDGDGGT